MTNISQINDVIELGNDVLGGSSLLKVLAYRIDSSNNSIELQIGEREKIGQGTFGKVYRAKLLPTQEIVAIKQVEIEERFKSRELDMLKQMIHPNIVRLKYFFHVSTNKELLCLIMEYMPMSAHRLISDYRRNQKILPLFYIKLFSYQMLRGLGYLHVHGVAHRDLKPANMVVDFDLGILKICDLGSAKRLVKNEKSVSYVSQSFEKTIDFQCLQLFHFKGLHTLLSFLYLSDNSAPELLLGSNEYTTAVDIWSAGCCLGEFLNGYAIFRGIDSSDQMYRIIKIIGIPTREELREMNPRYTGSVDLTVINYTPRTLRGYLPERTQESAFILLEQLLKYKPNERMTCQTALASDFFAELKQRSIVLPNKQSLPPLFNFYDDELSRNSFLYSSIVPDSLRNQNLD